MDGYERDTAGNIVNRGAHLVPDEHDNALRRREDKAAEDLFPSTPNDVIATTLGRILSVVNEIKASNENAKAAKGLALNDYQARAMKTAIYPNLVVIGDEKDGTNASWIYPVLALGGEVGELQNLLKKRIRDYQGEIDGETRQKVKGELGGILWYVAAIATEFDFTLEEVGRANLETLASRAKRGTLKGTGDDR